MTTSAIIVDINFGSSDWDPQHVEFQRLVASTGADIAEVVTAKRRVPDAKYFVGSGKAKEIKDIVVAHQADLVVFNHVLSPAQERNLERLMCVRVLDRTTLILDIFAQRARTFEGKLQVELAQLNHLLPRLVRGWTHLERQKGGVGMRGPGETQLETDRRLIGNRIKTLKARLEKVRKQRAQSRRSRQRARLPTVALVGYTNAGKSTLFNTLTKADAYSADQLFATLDPTLRQLYVQGFGKIIFADTVGFIRDLPHHLVDSFRATLEETREADLLVHIVDAADPLHDDHIVQVQDVLKQVGAEDVPQLLLYNKIDLLPPERQTPRIDYNQDELPWRVWASAHTKAGMDGVLEAVIDKLPK